VARNANVLRALRNRRISKRQISAQPAEEAPKTLSEQVKLEEVKDQMETVKPPQPEITTEKQLQKVTEETKEKLPETMKPEELSARVEGEDVVILHQRKPAFVIPSAGLKKLQKEVKGSRGLQSRILKEVLSDGLAAVLKRYGAKKVGEEKAKGMETQEAYAAIRSHLKRCLQLAFTAMGKNIMDNPIKHEFHEALEAAGIEDPVPVIESAYSRSIGPALEAAFAKADEYSRLTDEGFVEVEAEIEKAGTITPRAESKESAEAETMKRRASLGSLTPMGLGSGDPVDERRAKYRDIIPRIGVFRSM
jgi:hypothetical protein